MPVKRRRFLQISGLSAAVFAVGGAVVALRSGDYPSTSGRDLRVLDEKSFWILAALAAAVCPREGASVAGKPGDEPIGPLIAAEVDVSLRTWAAVDQRDFMLALGLVENGLSGLLVRGSISLFTDLDSDGRDQALYRMRDSRVSLVRAIYQSLRRTLLTVYYSNFERAKRTGYPGPKWVKPAAPAIVDDQPLSPPYVPKKPEPEEPAP